MSSKKNLTVLPLVVLIIGKLPKSDARIDSLGHFGERFERELVKVDSGVS